MNLEEFSGSEEEISEPKEVRKLRTFTIKDFIVDKIIKENFKKKKRKSKHKRHETGSSRENMGKSVFSASEDMDIKYKNIGDQIQSKETKEITRAKKEMEQKLVERVGMEQKHDQKGILEEVPEVIDMQQIERSIMLKKITESIWNLEAESFKDIIDSLQSDDLQIDDRETDSDNEINMMGNQNFKLKGEYDREYRESIEEWPFPVPIVLPVAPLNFHFDDTVHPLNEELGLSPLTELRKDSVSFENTPESFLMESDPSANDVSTDSSTSSKDLKD